MGFSNVCRLDVRLLGAIALATVTLIVLSIPEPVQKLAPTRVVRGEPGEHIVSFALSPTNAQIATTDRVGRLTLRDPEREWQTDRFLNFPGYAAAVAFSPDGRTLAALGSAPSICLWDLRSPRNEPTATVTVPIQQPKRIMYSPDGQSIAVTSYLDGTILLWDLATRRERVVLQQLSPVTNIAFSPDSRWLATGGRVNRPILIWDLRSGSRRTLQEGEPGAFNTALAYSPDGALLASAGFPAHHVRLWRRSSVRRHS
jgi:WD40 repeat protein